MTIRLGEIEKAEEHAKDLKHQYLRKHGWKETCSHPGAYWLWEREIKNKLYVVQEDLAISITRSAIFLGGLDEI